MSKEIVSVLMPIYKENEFFLRRSIESILNQTYRDIEFIIINDDPDNELNESLIYEYKFIDNRIVYIKNAHNCGITRSLNKGLDAASGTFICRMDADDYSYANRIETQIKFLKDNNIDFVGSNINYLLDMKCINKTCYPTHSKSIRKALAYKNCISHPTWFCYRRVFEIVGKYRDFKACEDYDFLMRCSLNNISMANISDTLLDYTLNKKGISLSKSALQEVTARYLRKNYKKNCVSDYEEYERFIESKKGKQSIKRVSRYLSIKNKRTFSRKNSFVFLFFTIIMLIYSYDFLYDFYNRVKFNNLKKGQINE